MAGDVESELRRAMQEDVAEVAALQSLVHDVRHRYRRRVKRVRALTATSLVVVAIAALPAYRVLLPQPADQEGAQVRAAGSATPTPGEQGAGSTRPGSAQTPGGLEQKNGTSTTAENNPQPTGKGEARQVLMYQPAGLRPAGPCKGYRLAAGEMTTCRWEGKPGEWVEVSTIRQPGLSKAESLPFPALLAQIKSVHKRRAIIGNRADGARQATWVERNGVGAYVVVAPSLRQQLMRIAEGMRPSA